MYLVVSLVLLREYFLPKIFFFFLNQNSLLSSAKPEQNQSKQQLCSSPPFFVEISKDRTAIALAWCVTSILSSFKALSYYGVVQAKEDDCCIKRVLFLVKDSGRRFPQHSRRAEDLVMGVVLVGVSSSFNSPDSSRESKMCQ